MKVYIEESVHEDGKQLWRAYLVDKAVSCDSRFSAANAAYEIIKWVKRSKDGKDLSVPELDLVFYDRPELPEGGYNELSDEIKLVMVRKRITAEQQKALFDEAGLIFLQRGIQPPACPPPRPHYKPAEAWVAEKFDKAEPFHDDYVSVPAGWDIRVGKE